MSLKSIFSDLRSPGLLGKKPIIGFMLFIFGAVVFTILAYNLVNNGPLIQLDLSIAKYFYTLALDSPKWIIDVMVLSYYAGLQGTGLIEILIGLYFLYKRFWKETVIAVVSLGGAGLLFLFLSNIFMRPRPFLLFDELIWSGGPNIPGFPSGHTLHIMVLGIFLVYLLWPKIKSYLGRTLLISITSLIIIFMGLSRIYVGDHYLTDVVAGYAVGIAWFALACTTIEWLFQRYNLRKEKAMREL